ncbi:hypothetical protein A3860_39215 [Niastella vici]|uniref:Uncharacterized protein n=1 Tax=Niastella vici TaxID=1703345 RepID=A0A1V9FKN5_9BACT|nr:hypothetical protein [Niastella vici]OQP58841.1 hypothetical protein A3860_39215 [Niastella vici]
MNEPLTNARPGISFSGKTHNNHPHWHNQPLRLSKEQKRDPLPVLDDFFECYHLNDVRQMLWQWLTTVISSHQSISNDALDRDNHLYFYEKIEGIIEAAYVMKRKLHKHRRNIEKRLLKKSCQPEHTQAIQTPEHSNSDTAAIRLAAENSDNEEVFNKPKQLLEYVDEAPMYVISEVFRCESLAFLRDQLRDWLHVALSADSSMYDDGEQRRQLLSFHDPLLVFVEALFIIYNQNRDKKVKNEMVETDKPRLLSKDQIANPMQVITGFFEKFPMVYIIRELNDWLEAGICYAGDYPDNMSELQVLYTYRNVLCLINAAARL